MNRWASVAIILWLGIPVTAAAADNVRSARELLDRLRTGDSAGAVTRFDATMRRVLPSPKLQQIWQQLQLQLGQFRSTGRVRKQKHKDHEQVFITCRFERGTLDAKVVFDSQGKIAGLFFVPVQETWSVPTYAQKDQVQELALQLGRAPALDAKLALPRGKGPYPAVVLVHGSGPQDMDSTVGAVKPFADLAWGLASQGITVLRFHKRSYQHPRSLTGNMTKLTVQDEVIRDVVDAAKMLRQRVEIDSKRVFVLGHSLGAELVPRIAAELPWLAGGVMLAARSRPMGQLVVEQVEHIIRLDGMIDSEEEQRLREARAFRQQVSSPRLKPDDSVVLFGSKTPGAYWLDLRRHDPLKAAQRISTPLLVLQGGRDYQVTVADFKGWQRVLSGRPQTRLRLFKTLNHLFVSGQGVSSPEEYSKPGHLDRAVVEEIVRWTSQQRSSR